MTKEQLEKANEIFEDIEFCKKNIEAAKYTQFDNVAIRRTWLKIDGTETEIEVPKSLFRVIGKIILVEHENEFAKLLKEFENF
jgi:hypothetical protein